MDIWGYHPVADDGNRLYGLCFAMGANVSMGATVITNLFSAIPIVGESVVTFLWGGFSVDNPTLNRFFALHYLLPFVLVGVIFFHIAAMHVAGSNNPTGVEPKTCQDVVMFHPFMTAKDSISIVIFLMVFAFFVFYAPNYMGHPDNYIPCRSLSNATTYRTRMVFPALLCDFTRG